MHVPVRIAERAFRLDELGVDVALDDDLGLGGRLQRNRFALHQPDGCADQPAGDGQLVHAVGQISTTRIPASAPAPLDSSSGF